MSCQGFHGRLSCFITSWTFLTNHARVLVCVVRNPGALVREIAECVGVTERAAHRLLSDLCQEGYVTRTRIGSRNHYEANLDLPLRHPADRDHSVGEVLAPLLEV